MPSRGYHECWFAVLTAQQIAAFCVRLRVGFMGYASWGTLVVVLCLLVVHFRGSGAFVVVPGGGGIKHTPRLCHEHRARPAHRRRLQVLSLAPRPQAEAAETAEGAGAKDGRELSGREAVEQAGERLIPLFAQVDAHTQRWVFRPLCRPVNKVTVKQGRDCRELYSYSPAERPEK